MVKQIADILKAKLKTLPFGDHVFGIADTLAVEEALGDNTGTVTRRYPVSYDKNIVDENGRVKEIMLVPDGAKRSILYFEDFGTSNAGYRAGIPTWRTNLRLIVWFDRSKLFGDPYVERSAEMMALINGKIGALNPFSSGPFTRIKITMQRVAPRDPGLFGRYTYSEAVRQYLRPPFDYFGIDFIVDFQIPAKCLEEINWDVQACE